MNSFFSAITESWFWRYFFSHLGWVDWTLVVFLLGGMIVGLRHGLSGELPRLLEILISLCVTFEYYGWMADWLARETPWPESYGRPFSFAIIGVSSWFILRLLFQIAGKMIRFQAASPLQALGGLLGGAIRSFLLFGLVSYFLVLFPLEWIHRSFQVHSWSGQVVAQVPLKLYGWIKGRLSLMRS